MEIIFVLILVGAAVAAEYLVYIRSGFKRLSYKASVGKSEVFEGEEVILTETIVNGKLLPLPFVKTEIVAPAFLDFGVAAEENKEGLCCIPSVFSLRGRERCRRVRSIKCTCRGRFEIGASSLYGSDLFGLGEFVFPVTDAKVWLTVLPAPLSAEDITPDNRQLYGDILVRRFICEDPFLVNGAHEYTGREPMNSIAWSACARTGKLMAVNRDYTSCSKMLIMLNFQRRDDIVTAATAEVCELLIKAAAFVMERAEEMRAEYALAINIPDEEPLAFGSGTEFKLEQLRRLALLKADCNLRIEDFLRDQPVGEFTDAVLITPTFSEESAEYLEKLRGQGMGVRAYAVRDETNADFCSRITRRVREEA
ncbi:MAG: DUF58 domain-containing protein [Bacteroides sp.]|nr:DUF58 domain-containing protein [Bacteroides sp.]